MKRSARVVAGLLLAMTFVVGGLTGMVLEEALGIDWFDFLDEDYAAQEDRVLAGLELTRAQRTQAEEILDRQEERLESYWLTRIPEIQQMLESSYDEIRALLTPEQRALFDRRVRDLEGRVPEEIRD